MKQTTALFLKKHLTKQKINRFWFIYYAVGVIGFAIPLTRGLFRELIGISILLSLVLMFFFHRPWNGRFIIASLVVVLGGFSIEAIGTNTGHIFGQYYYGNTLGPGIFNTPFLIGLNWWMLIYIVSQIVGHTRLKTLTQLMLGAIIMTGYDAFLEPVAMATDMWNWSGQTIPVQNYLAWFLISTLFLGIFKGLKINYNNPVAEKLLTAQIIFFVLLNLIDQTAGL